MLRLHYNDYSIDTLSRPKTTCVLRLLRRLRRAGAPVHAVGLQAHVHAHPAVAAGAFATAAACARMGLAVFVSELDVTVDGGERPRARAVCLGRCPDHGSLPQSRPGRRST